MRDTGTRTRDRLYRSGPSPDLVQTVPGGTFILGRVDTVRGSRGGQVGGEVVGKHGPASNPSIMPSALFSAICRDRWSVAGQRKGGYIEEAADGADHEAGLVEAHDACGICLFTHSQGPGVGMSWSVDVPSTY